MQLGFAIMFGAIGGLLGGLIVALIMSLRKWPRKSSADYLYPKPTNPPQQRRIRDARKGEF